MPNERAGKAVDKTFLSVDTAEQRLYLHRDYLAHAFRWSHVVRFLQRSGKYKTARILDVGCGKEVPLAKTMYSSRMIPLDYLGVDVNKLAAPEMFHTGKFPLRLMGETDICDIEFTHPDTPRFNVVTCFEVLEHVEPAHAVRLLRHLHRLITPDCVAFFSTPCYDPQVGAAANHVNEMTHDVVKCLLEQCGWAINNHWGTFASQRNYWPKLQAKGLEPVFNELYEYYDSNVLACIFAPLFPEQARNCLWEVTSTLRQFQPSISQLEALPKPWGSTSEVEWAKALEELKNGE